VVILATGGACSIRNEPARRRLLPPCRLKCTAMEITTHERSTGNHPGSGWKNLFTRLIGRYLILSLNYQVPKKLSRPVAGIAEGVRYSIGQWYPKISRI